MVAVTEEKMIRCSPADFLEFVMDIEKYAEADDKLGTFDWVRRDEDLVEFKFRPILPGLPKPAPKMVARGRLTPGERIDVTLSPLPYNKLYNRLMDFSAGFVVESIPGGIRVKRTFGVDFHPAVRWLLDPILRRTLPRDVQSEMRAAKTLLERDPNPEEPRSGSGPPP